MKATDFNLSKDLKFDPKSGITSFKENRFLIFDSNAFGLLRQDLIEEIGGEKARDFFLRFGYQNGIADFHSMKASYTFDSELDLLASGPVMHTWEGIVKATPREIQFDREKGEFYFTGVWGNSYEAEQHIMANEMGTEPVCWSLAGYASGWCTAFFGAPLLAMEPKCTGKGDEHCEWLIKPVKEWGPEASTTINALKCYWRL